MTSLYQLIPDSWRKVLSEDAKSSLFLLESFLETQNHVLPARENIFAALAATPLAKVKAVVLGQDPYPTPGHANGLSFSVERGVKLPGSLRNIFKALEFELGIPKATHGDLSAWAKQGVLLLNTVLTVEAQKANAHQKRGWEKVTREWLLAIDALSTPVVFFCFGKPAQKLVETCVTSSRHLILRTPHPSPLTQGAFLKTVEKDFPFTKANEFLRSNGRTPIDWRLED